MSMTLEEVEAILHYNKVLGDHIIKNKRELDAMWVHIRNLEEKLLNPQEY